MKDKKFMCLLTALQNDEPEREKITSAVGEICKHLKGMNVNEIAFILEYVKRHTRENACLAEGEVE